ncbi:MAG: TolC family protein [Flammeovirgaceae bacterium]|nr:TolC family protein [Flammeovirgaceae bacterium]
MTFLKQGIITTIICLAFSQLFAQTPLSLSDAVQMGLDNNFDIRIESKNVEINTNNNNWGQAGRYPTIQIGVTQGNSRRDVQNPASFLQGATITNNLNPTVSLNWVLFDGMRANITKSRLEKLQAESEGNAAVIVQNAIEAIILGYFRAVYEKERIDVLQTTLTVSRDKYDYVLLKKDLGSAVTTDVLLDEGNYLTDSINFLNQELIYRNAVRDLNFILAVSDVEQDYFFTDSLQYLVDDFKFDELQDRMMSNNANLRKEYITQAIMKDNISLAKADLYPRIDLGVSYSYDKSRVDISNTTLAGPDRDPVANARTTNLGANFSLTYNLFNGGRVKRAIKNSIINYDIENLRVEQLKQSLNLDLAAALDLYNNRVLLKGIASRRKASAELNLELSLEKFKTGTINSFDYRQVQNQYLLSAVQDLEATFNLIDSNAAILRLTGGIIDIIE